MSMFVKTSPNMYAKNEVKSWHNTICGFTCQYDLRNLLCDSLEEHEWQLFFTEIS